MEQRLLSLNTIQPNVLNNRSMNEESIKTLAKIIKESGLRTAMAVYENSDGTYTLLSGHRRLEALKLLYGNRYKVICNVWEKPENEYAERKLMQQIGFNRRSEEDILNEVKIGKELWDTMDPQEKQEFTEKAKENFIKKNENNPMYIADAKDYTRAYFRARYDFIRECTGLDSCNMTIAKMLKKIEPKSDELKQDIATMQQANAAQNPSSPKKPRRITTTNICDTVDKLTGMLKTHILYNNDTDYTNLANQIITICDEFENEVQTNNWK